MIWLAVIGMSCITFLNRFAFLLPGFRYQPSQRLTRFLSFSSLAVLTAIWVPIVFTANASFSFSSHGTDYIVGATVAMLLSLLRLHSLLVVLISTAVFFALRFYGIHLF